MVEGVGELVREGEDASVVGARLQDGLGLELAELRGEPLLPFLSHSQPLPRLLQLLPHLLLSLHALPELPLQLRVPLPQRSRFFFLMISLCHIAGTSRSYVSYFGATRDVCSYIYRHETRAYTDVERAYMSRFNECIRSAEISSPFA